jgi:FAD/FMN-containing dehydrogenase/Fe-S oxidoreductase
MGPVALPAPTTRPLDDPLFRALREAVRGEVRFDLGSRALYSTDASNYRQVPVGVVLPLDTDDVQAAVAVCHRFGAPVVSRGGGTSLGGQGTNTAVVIDFSKYVNRVESIDPGRRTALVQAGCVLDALNDAAATHGLVFGPKPATHSRCTIGGMVGNNSCGATAQWAGTTAANVLRLEVLTHDGLRMWVGPTSDEEYATILAGGGRRAAIYRALRELRDGHADRIRAGFPDIPRRISGYNLPDLLPENGFNLARALVGTESTCVLVLRAELALLPAPRHVALVLAGYTDITIAADHVPAAAAHQPYVLEGLDHKLITYERERRLNVLALHDLPDVGAWLMIKMVGDDAQSARTAAEKLRDALRDDGGVVYDQIYDSAGRIEELDSVREAALGTTARVPGMPDTWPGWEDSAVDPRRLGDYLRDLSALLAEYGHQATALYGHFGHGCVHASIPFELTTTDGIAAFRSFVTRAARLVVGYGGSLSGEHGDGQARGELLDIMYGPDLLDAMAAFKAAFDPRGRMNPGKVLAARPLDADLRLGTGWRPVADTWFDYPADGGFGGVPTRCFGVGACRRTHTDGGGVMCPSYQVTRAEEHSTRGRMRLLFEMLRGEVLTDQWRSTEVHDALDLCLACKGCRSDCPVSVDMATYKAEFLAQHYAGRLRPRTHYTLGWLPLLAAGASRAPRLANAIARSPRLGRWARSLAGIDPQRSLPPFARKRFTAAFRGSEAPAPRGGVLLWPDTFTNYLAPHIAASAADVLTAAGFAVRLPARPVCCGLTWISTGQLGMARRVLARSLRALAPYLEAGLPVVGLEPSCTSVLRADAVNLLRGGGKGRAAPAELLALAGRLQAQTVTFAELLEKHAVQFRPSLGSVDGAPIKAIVQQHCHQHAVLGGAPDQALLRRLGIDATVLDSGCCGLAGDFGMTTEHREVSLACAERGLYPALREADARTLVLADGFSCRLQIASGDSGRRGVHLAEVVAAAVRHEPIGSHPEQTVSP